MQPRTSSSSDAFSRRVEAAIPAALDYLPQGEVGSERIARELVERVLAAADRKDERSRSVTRQRAIQIVVGILTDWGSRVAVADRERLAANIVGAFSLRSAHESELARLRAVEEAAREAHAIWMFGGDFPAQMHRLRSALSEPAAEGSGE